MVKQTNIRGIATAALVAVVGLFVLSFAMERLYGGWGWQALKAFSEAATVGALADWFAVVALFRHPMGLPIPHTAVLVRKQGSIARSIAAFFCENFWVPSEVRARLVDASPSRYLVSMLEQSSSAMECLRNGLLEHLSRFLSAPQHRKNIAEIMAGVLPSVPLKAIVQGLVKGVGKSELPATSTDIFVTEAANYARNNKDVIAREVAACVDFSRLMPRNAGGGLFDILGGGVNQLVVESVRNIAGPLVAERVCVYAEGIVCDKNHHIRREIERAINQALADIAAGNKYDQELTQALESLTSRDSVASFLESVLPLLHKQIPVDYQTSTETAQRLRTVLANNPGLCAALDQLIADIAADFVARTSEIVAKELESTIRAWNMNTMVTKIESQVGNDFQYIRLNGTIVGGLIGLGIYGLNCLLTICN